RIFLRKTLPTNRVLIVIGIDAAGCKHGDMNSLKEASIREIQCSNDIAPNSSLLVVLAPVDIGTSRATSTVQNMGWLDLIKNTNNLFTTFHALREELSYIFGECSGHRMYLRTVVVWTSSPAALSCCAKCWAIQPNNTELATIDRAESSLRTLSAPNEKSVSGNN